MLLERLIFPALDTAKPADLSKAIGGLILSREVENCSPETLRFYKDRLGGFARFLDLECPGVDLSNLTRQHIELYLLHLQQQGRRPATLRTSYTALRAFFNWCIEEGFLEHSPMRNIKAPRLPKVGKGFLSEEDRNKLLELCPPTTFMGARDAAVIWLFWTTGMRLRECASLQVTNLSWEHDKIRVLGKGAKERYLPFTKEAKKAVWRYLSYRSDTFQQLWLTEERRPLTLNGFAQIIKRLVARAGFNGHIKDLHHIFRRSWAMRNLKAGVPQKYVQLIGGWESVTTLEQYVRAMESEDALDANWV